MRAQADMITLIGLLFIVAISFFLVAQIWAQLNKTSTFTTLTNATPEGQLAVKNVNTSLGIFGDSIVILFFVGAIASIIASAFTTSNPIFAVLAFILLPVEVLFAFVFHDVFFSIVQNSFFAGLVNTYPFVFTLFQYLPVTAFILSLLMIFITFAK